MSRWLVWALVALLGWAIWAFSVTKASAHGRSTWGVLAGLVVVEGLVVAPRLRETRFSWWIVLAGIAGVVAYWALVESTRTSPGTAGAAVAISAAYPVLTALLMVVTGAEPVSWRLMAGIALAVGAVVTVSV